MAQHLPYTIIPDGGVTLPKGFKAAGLHCGLKRSGRHDLGAICCEVEAAAAGVFTTNLFQAAPVAVTRESLAQAAASCAQSSSTAAMPMHAQGRKAKRMRARCAR